MKLELAQINSSDFTINHAKKTLVTEMSTFNGMPYVLRRIYDDSCDMGLAMVGKTGCVTVWVVAGYRKDNEGFYTVDLHPTCKSIAQYPAIDGYVMTIYNT